MMKYFSHIFSDVIMVILSLFRFFCLRMIESRDYSPLFKYSDRNMTVSLKEWSRIELRKSVACDSLQALTSKKE